MPYGISITPLSQPMERGTYIVASEITTLKHELGDHTVEAGALVALALGSLAELTEVLSGLGDISLEQVEVDAAGFGCKEGSKKVSSR